MIFPSTEQHHIQGLYKNVWQRVNSTIFYILTECSEIKADKKQTIEINNLQIFPPCANLCMNKYTRTWFTQMVH